MFETIRRIYWGALACTVACGVGAVLVFALDGVFGLGVALGSIALIGAATVVPVLRAVRAVAGPARSVATWAAGVGTVVEVEQAGLIVNGWPTLELLLDIDTPDGIRLRGFAKTLVDPFEASCIVPGMTFPVRYQPGSHPRGRAETVAVIDREVVSGEEFALLAYRARAARGEVSRQEYAAAEHGVETTAVLLALHPSDEAGRWDFTVRLRRPDGTTEDRTVVKPLTPQEEGKYLIGSALRVRYLPHDRSALVIIERPG